MEQHEVYLVLSPDEIAKGFVRPLRRAYRHIKCKYDPGHVTTMGLGLCETYARDPFFYGATYCTSCRMHKAVAEFAWVEDGQPVGS